MKLDQIDERIHSILVEVVNYEEIPDWESYRDAVADRLSDMYCELETKEIFPKYSDFSNYFHKKIDEYVSGRKGVI